MTRRDLGLFLYAYWWQCGVIALLIVGWVVRVEAMAEDYRKHEAWAAKRNDLLVEVKADVDGIAALLKATRRLDCHMVGQIREAWNLRLAMGIPCDSLLGNRTGGTR